MKKVLLIALALVLAIAPAAIATDYYVDNAASGANNGTSWTNAWESFADINWAGISGGDNIYISGGSSSKTYNEQLSITQGGSSVTNLVTVAAGAYSPSPSGHNGQVRIDAQHTRNFCIYGGSSSDDYIKVRGFYCEDGEDKGIKFEGDYVTVENCTIASIDGGGIRFNGDYSVARGNTITTDSSNSAQTDGIVIYGLATGVLIENNHITISNQTSGPHVDGVQSYRNTNMTVRYNYVENTKTEHSDAQGIYLEEMYGHTRAYGNIVHVHEGPQALSNRIYSVGNARAYYYNNTLNSNYRGGVVITDGPNDVIKNNALYYTGSLYCMYINNGPSGSGIDYNAYDTNGDTTAWYEGSTRTWSYWQSTLGHDTNGLNISDLGMDGYSNNSQYNLESGSQLIDAGTFITQTNSAGSGTQIPVDDARCFYDPIANWTTGDEIQLDGQVQTATIIDVNYSSHVITVDRALSWNDNQGLHLAYNGSDPDIGAREYGGASPQPNYDPVVAITSPTSNPTYTTSASSINLSGSATDSDGTIASMSWSCSTCTPTSGSPTADDGTFDEASDPWTASSIGLAADANTITVTATDDDGDTGSDIITVTRATNTPPVVTIDDPSASATYSTTDATDTVGGTAADSDGTIASLTGSCTGCTPSTFTVTCDDGTCDEAAEDWTSETLTLTAGNNVIVVTATDDDSDTGSDTITINQGQEGVVEAESGTENAPMAEATDGSITYIYSPTSNSGDTTVVLTAATSGDYEIICNTYGADGASDSMKITVNGGSQQIWHFNPEELAGQHGVWREDAISAQGTGTYNNPEFDPYVVTLSAGTAPLKFDTRESNARVDYCYLKFIPNPQTAPLSNITQPTTHETATLMKDVSIVATLTASNALASANWEIDCADDNYDNTGSFTTPDDGTWDETAEQVTKAFSDLPEGDCTYIVYASDGTTTGASDILTFTVVKGSHYGGSGTVK